MLTTTYSPQTRLSRTLILIAVLALSLFPTCALAQGIGELPIFTAIISTLEANSVPIATIGIMVIGLAMLAKPIAPEWAAQNRGAITAMIMGGILFAMAGTIVPMLFTA